MNITTYWRGLVGALAGSMWAASAVAAAVPPASDGKVSYYGEVRPIFQAQCLGCHQPAKAKGGYVMTDFAKLLGKGDTGEDAILPGKLDQGLLLKQIALVDGKAEMPKGQTPLAAPEIELTRSAQAWLDQRDRSKESLRRIEDLQRGVFGQRK